MPAHDDSDEPNKIREGLFRDDKGDSYFEKDPETGETTIYRKIGGEYREYHPGRGASDEDDEE
jgi:hypothetical protein